MPGNSARAGMLRYSGLKWNQPRMPTSSSGTSFSTVRTFCITAKAPMPRRLTKVQNQIEPIAVATIRIGSASAGMNTRR
ncbi:hypothetical protein D3C76_1337970 [compost metagenome]